MSRDWSCYAKLPVRAQGGAALRQTTPRTGEVVWVCRSIALKTPRICRSPR